MTYADEFHHAAAPTYQKLLEYYIRMVIDGQQRLTTLSILAKVLCLMTDEEDGFIRRFQLDKKRGFKPVLQHSQYDEAAYNRIIALKQLEELPGEDTADRRRDPFLHNSHYRTMYAKI